MSADDLKNLCATELIALCAANTTDAKLRSEFLRRFSPKVRFFVRRTLRSVLNGSAYSAEGPPIGVDHQSDLFQNTILRLVDHDCAAMRRFRGTCEPDFVVYLAAVTESVVRGLHSATESFETTLRNAKSSRRRRSGRQRHMAYGAGCRTTRSRQRIAETEHPRIADPVRPAVPAGQEDFRTLFFAGIVRIPNRQSDRTVK